MPSTRSKLPPSFQEDLHRVRTISDLSSQVLRRVKEIVPADAALFVISQSRIISPNGFPEELLKRLQLRFEKSPDLLRDLTGPEGGLRLPVPTADGSSVFCVPI